MIAHGEVFESWASANAPEQHAEKILANGCHIDVRARQSPSGKIEVFFGTYKPDGKLIKESIKVRESIASLKDGVEFGIDEATRYAGGGGGASLDNHHQATPI